VVACAGMGRDDVHHGLGGASQLLPLPPDVATPCPPLLWGVPGVSTPSNPDIVLLPTVHLHHLQHAVAVAGRRDNPKLHGSLRT